VQSRRKEVERLQVTELAKSNIQRPFIKFEQKRPSGKHILEIEHLGKSYGNNQVIRDFTASITRGEKIALMGRNGAGKTTLLNSLLANSPTTPDAELRKTSGYDGPYLDSGKVIWGHEASIGYFAQDHRSLIETGTTAIEWLHQWDPAAVTEELRGVLGQMLFAREEATKSTTVLSGGEAARLLFCKLMLQKPNVLVLDEPTNHLDLESINALNIALQRYQGTVLLVTHDHDRRSGHARLALRKRSQDHRFQGHVRGVSVSRSSCLNTFTSEAQKKEEKENRFFHDSVFSVMN
jgi:ATPase subunit of ABC transporter with duplicated ATPase domains